MTDLFDIMLHATSHALDVIAQETKDAVQSEDIVITEHLHTAVRVW